MKAIRIEETGGPEVMKLVDVDLPPPAPGQVRIRHSAIGLNFIDIYHRTGLYPLPLPTGLGLEAAGVVEEVGEGVTSLQVGDRVAYAPGPIGAYSQAANVPANRVLKLPDTIPDETAAGMMLRGMTARYLLKETYKVKPGDTILFHAAAGGVGLIACQWANAIGATVIGTVGSEEKAELARANGCHHTINYQTEDVVARVLEITDGKKVPVVYDSVGQATLDCLRLRGLLVSFGNASGPIRNFDTGLLSTKGSLYLTRPTLMGYVGTDEELRTTANDLFEMVGSGRIKIRIGQRYPLSEIGRACRSRSAEDHRVDGHPALTFRGPARSCGRPAVRTPDGVSP